MSLLEWERAGGGIQWSGGKDQCEWRMLVIMHVFVCMYACMHVCMYMCMLECDTVVCTYAIHSAFTVWIVLFEKMTTDTT